MEQTGQCNGASCCRHRQLGCAAGMLGCCILPEGMCHLSSIAFVCPACLCGAATGAASAGASAAASAAGVSCCRGCGSTLCTTFGPLSSRTPVRSRQVSTAAEAARESAGCAGATSAFSRCFLPGPQRGHARSAHARSADVSAALCYWSSITLPPTQPYATLVLPPPPPQLNPATPAMLPHPPTPAADYWEYARWRAGHRFFSSMASIFASQVCGGQAPHPVTPGSPPAPTHPTGNPPTPPHPTPQSLLQAVGVGAKRSLPAGGCLGLVESRGVGFHGVGFDVLGGSQAVAAPDSPT